MLDTPAPFDFLIRMPYQFYKVLHLAGVFLILVSLAGVIFHTISGGTKANAARRLAAITHGVGMLILFVAGFGLLAKLGIHWPWPGYIFVKFGLWLLMGGLLALAYRPGMVRLLWFVVPLVAVLAGFLAIYKPF